MVLNNYQEELEKLFQWFRANYLVANADKCHLLTIIWPKDRDKL